MNKYRIVFMGTPDFGVPALEAMTLNGYKPVAIYCQPDRINGRGRKINYSPVKSFGLSHDIPVYQPGSLKNMETFFARMKQLLNEGGAIFMDSSDIHYVFEDEDGSMLIDLNGDYYGELVYSMKYRNIIGPEFKWLYVDFDTLAYYASQNGFKAELITQGEHYDYLARLTATK